MEMLSSIADYATIALENSRLYEELKSMNKAKERAIDHLSSRVGNALRPNLSDVCQDFKWAQPGKDHRTGEKRDHRPKESTSFDATSGGD